MPNTVRPDLIGPIRIVGSVDQWFDPTAFAAVNRFGTLGRNVVIGPSFHNTDVSIIKRVTIGQRYLLQLRADVFNLFNHPNFGPPGNVVGSPTFGKISRTRLPTYGRRRSAIQALNRRARSSDTRICEPYSSRW